MNISKRRINTRLSELRKRADVLAPQMSSDVRALIDLLMELFSILLLSGTHGYSTSNLSPSQDPFREKKKKKNGAGRKPGGQKGHAGKTIELSDNPDQVIRHVANICDACHLSLGNTPAASVSRHQIFDVEIKATIVEHQVEHKTCSCGHHQIAATPFPFNAPAQYGPHIKAIAVEMNQIQCVPSKRVSEFLKEKFLLSVSPATILAFAKEVSSKLKEWEASVRQAFLNVPLLHADETGINIGGKGHWAHTLSTPDTTLIIPHQRRGGDAIDEFDILPNFKGILCHDFWAPYSKLDVIHSVCHAHLQRELARVVEDHQQTWAKRLGELLLEAKNERDNFQGNLPIERVQYYEGRYKILTAEGDRLNPRKEDRTHQRGRIAQDYPRKLLDRLIGYKSWVLLFLYNPLVPFTNNQVERDHRMLKTQQKVSGCFRSFAGATDHCRIRSYISTMRKRGMSNHQALTELFSGT